MKRSTKRLAVGGAVLIALSLGGVLMSLITDNPMPAWYSVITTVIGLVILIVADKRAAREDAYDKEITARVVHKMSALRRFEGKMQKSVDVARRLKKIGDGKRAGPEKTKKKKTRWQLYECRFCDWKGERIIKKKNGQRMCPSCRQPVRKVPR